MIPGRKLAKRNLGHVLVLGLGVSGKACAIYLSSMITERLESLTVYAGARTDASLAWIADHSEQLESADIIFDTESIEGSFDLCIASPGISEFSDFYQDAKAVSAEIISEVEFAWRESMSSSRWVAITGTNGKTTTTSLIAHILKEAGANACAVGNIGDACIEAVGKDVREATEREAADQEAIGHEEGEGTKATTRREAGLCASDRIYVVETSSYQLASIKDFAPDVAVILGITPDHLTWHKTHENYAKAKFKLLSNLAKNSGVAVLDALNDEVRAKVRELKAATGTDAIAYIPIGTAKGIDHDMRAACGSANSAFIDGDTRLHVAFSGEDHVLIEADGLKLEGAHNRLNALAAASACVAIGASDDAIGRGLRTFEPLEHRIEPAGSWNGVDFFNDSKATNVDATLVAITAFLPKRPIVLLGGRDKLSPLDDLVGSCTQNAKAVICYGESKDRFLEAFLPFRDKDGFAVLEAKGMDDAFDTALGIARHGDVVLLSPACASFDEFTCFEERGDHFKELVAQLGSKARIAEGA